MKIKEILWEFYDKYIKINSDYEINIASRDRTRLKRLMPNKQTWMNNNSEKINDTKYLANILERYRKEMYRLIRFSFGRLKSNKPNVYQNLARILDIDLEENNVVQINKQDTLADDDRKENDIQITFQQSETMSQDQ